jgi:hypothetical protein
LIDPDGGGLSPDNVTTVTADDATLPDGVPREQAIPTRTEVFNALYTFRRAVDDHVKDNPEDWEKTRLYFYISGHGIAPEPKDAALLMANAGRDWYGENISCSQILSFFGECQSFREVVVFADCCRERISNAPLGGVPWTRISGDNGSVQTVLGCATYFGDIALEPTGEAGQGVGGEDDPDTLRGYFTQALLEGLRGQAADPATGEINSKRLAEYVKPRVEDLTRHRPHPQEPTMDLDPASPVVFGAGKPIEEYQVRLTFVTPFQGTALLLNGKNEEIDEHVMPDGDWVVRLANGIYQVIAEDQAAGVNLRKGGFFRVWGEDLNVEL